MKYKISYPKEVIASSPCSLAPCPYTQKLTIIGATQQEKDMLYAIAESVAYYYPALKFESINYTTIPMAHAIAREICLGDKRFKKDRHTIIVFKS